MNVRLVLGAVLAVGVFLRSAGLFRELSWEHTIHPDEPKQIMTLWRYLQGNYLLWRGAGSFYDGYPFGLNLVDYFFVRCWGILAAFLGFEVDVPARGNLYYAARLLRVLYGTGCVVLVAIAARKLFVSKTASVVATLLAAVIPVSYAVTHTATGDVGVDLAAAATIAVLAAFRPGVLTYGIAGLIVGFGVAAKSHAVVLSGLVFTFIALRHGNAFGVVLSSLAAVALGSSLGYALLTPWAWVDPARTIDVTWQHMKYAQTYGAPAELLALPVPQRLWAGLSANLARLAPALGLGTCVLAVAGSVLAVRRSRREAADPERLVLALAIFTVPVLLFICATKLYVQPFHVSFLVFPLALLVGKAVDVSLESGGIVLRAGAVIVAIVALVELGVTAERETYFWLRDDVRSTAALAASAFHADGEVDQDLDERSSSLRSLRLERSNASVFRNLPRRVVHPDGPFWRSVGGVPAPAVPFERSTHWVFVDGPELLRSDRRIVLDAGRPIERGLVFYGAVSEITVGVRSGRLPSRVDVRVGSEKHTFRLDPDTQSTWSVQPKRDRRQAGAGPGGVDVFVVSLTARSWGGPVEIAILKSSGAAARFSAFGGSGIDSLAGWAESLPRDGIRSRIPDLAFVEGADEHPVEVGDGLPLDLRGLSLPSGPYLVECDLLSAKSPITARLVLEDPRGLAGEIPVSAPVVVDEGSGTATFRFQKPLVPQEVSLLLRCEEDCLSTGWRLRPDVDRILVDLDRFVRSGEKPEWAARFPSLSRAPERRLGEAARIGRGLELVSVAFPEMLRQGESFRYGLRFGIWPERVERFARLVVFVHLVDANGKTARTFDFPLERAAFGASPLLPREAAADLAPGVYRLRIGVWDPISTKRLGVDQSRRGSIELGKVEVTG